MLKLAKRGKRADRPVCRMAVWCLTATAAGWENIGSFFYKTDTGTGRFVLKEFCRPVRLKDMSVYR